VKQPQWITVGAGVILTLAIFVFGRTVPHKKHIEAEVHGADDGHNHGPVTASFSIDSLLISEKKQLKPEQVTRLTLLENSISRGDVKDQQLHVFHQLARFWGDTAQAAIPQAWYTAEAARLENSEKTLTFAARLFLEYLQHEPRPALRQWEALQAKDLFERSLIINPANDSAKVGIGACYLFGNISAAPMEGLSKIMEVVARDSTNVYAQLTLAKGGMMSGQLDKAITRLQLVNRLQPDNLEAILMLADIYERSDKKALAAEWYEKSLNYIKPADVKAEVRKRIEELKK